MSKFYDIRNDFKIFMVAKAITAERGKGSPSREKIETVLRELKEVTGINNLHKLSGESVKSFYSYIQESGQANSTVSNKISYFNQVLEYAGKTELKQTAKELGESRKNDIYSYKGNSIQDMKIVQDYFRQVGKVEFTGLYHAQRLQELAGLRMAESGGVKLLEKDINELKQGILRIDGKADLSKNDRDRVIYLDKDGIQAVLDARAWLQENNLRDIAESRPGKIKEWTAYSWRQIDSLKKAGIIDANYHNHGNRHVWANQKYETLWENRTGVKIEATAKAGLFDKDWIHYVETKTGLNREEIRKIDGEVRHEVSQQLGHERISITSTYLGKKAI
ncbi:MAG: hypothetical protein ACYCUT_05530 [bacterium]